MNERETNPTEREEPDWLGAWVVPPARAQFRESLRAAFVGAEASGASGAVPESRPDTEPESTDVAASPASVDALERELAPFLDALDAPPADPEFARELQDEFVAGPRPVRQPRRVPPVPRPASRLSLRLRLVAGGLAAAAAAWLLFLRPGPITPQATPPGLRLVPGSYTSVAELSADEAPLREFDLASIDEALSAAQTISTGGSAARFQFDEYFVVELAPDSQLRWVSADPLPEAAASASGAEPRGFTLRGERGSIRVATGPAFDGSTLVVEAPYMDVEVVGTVFGVDIFDKVATCLCCVEGTVKVRPNNAPGHEEHEVGAGFTSLVGPGVGHHKEVSSEHGAPLERLAEFWN